MKLVLSTANNPKLNGKKGEPDWPEWMDLACSVRYACVSERTLRSWINRAIDPLPATKVEGKIYIKRSVLDQWLEAHPYRPTESVDLNAVVNDIVREVGARN